MNILLILAIFWPALAGLVIFLTPGCKENKQLRGRAVNAALAVELALTLAMCMGQGTKMVLLNMTQTLRIEMNVDMTGCIFAVLVAGILDAVVGYLLGNIHGLALPFEYTVFVCPLVVAWYILMELGSILENIGKMGAPLPEILKKMIVVLKATVDSAGDVASGDHAGSENN